MKVLSGTINYYRVFDIGSEIDLQIASKILERSSEPTPFTLKKNPRAVIIEDAPVVLSLGTWEQEIVNCGNFKVQATGKLWSYGAVSISLSLELGKELTIDELKKWVHAVEKDYNLHQICLTRATDLSNQIRTAITGFKIWEHFEDYIMVLVDKFQHDGVAPAQFLQSNDVCSLILLDEKGSVSEQMRNSLISSSLQYSSDDLVVVDWNSALIIDPVDARDISNVIEFALCQLLELRYYDSDLDIQLHQLYNSLTLRKHTIFSNKYSQLSKEAAMIYIEITKVIEKIENSLKVIGDFYYAQVFRTAVGKFRIKDWQQSIDSKLNNFAEISKLFHGEINEKRNQLMEIIIIILIAIEVVPFVNGVLKSWWAAAGN